MIIERKQITNTAKEARINL